MIGAAIAPYATAIKLGAAALFVLALIIPSCRYGQSMERGATERAQAEANKAKAGAAVLAETLRGIDAETAQREAQAKRDAKRAQEAAERAAKAAAVHAAQLAAIERDIEQAKKNPTCRKALEAPTCAALH